MADKEYSIKYKYEADAKGIQKATQDAAKSTAQLEREARMKTRKMEQSFKNVAMSVAKIGAVLGAARLALGLVTTAMKSTEGGADKLRESTDYAKGAFQGFFRTITTGGWDRLLFNIRETARSMKEMGIALDELEDRLVGDRVVLARWERQLQEARLEYAEFKDTDPGRAKQALENAISLQEQITERTIQGLRERTNITEKHYKNLFGLDNAYVNKLMKMLPMISENQRKFLDQETLEIQRARKKELEHFKSLGGAAWTPARKAEYQNLKEFINAVDLFVEIRDDLSKPGQFNEFIGQLAEIDEAAARGGQSLYRLVGQLRTMKDEVGDGGIVRVKGPDAVGFTGKLSRVSHQSKVPQTLAGAPKMSQYAIDEMNRMNEMLEAQQGYVYDLQGAFVDMFGNVDKGFKGMADSLIENIKRMVIEMAAWYAAMAILNIIAPGSGTAVSAFTGFTKRFGFAPFAEGGIVSGPTFAQVGEYAGARSNPEVIAPLDKLKSIMGPQTITVKGKIAGRDIYLSNDRYGRMLNKTT